MNHTIKDSSSFTIPADSDVCAVRIGISVNKCPWIKTPADSLKIAVNTKTGETKSDDKWWEILLSAEKPK